MTRFLILLKARLLWLWEDGTKREWTMLILVMGIAFSLMLYRASRG